MWQLLRNAEMIFVPHGEVYVGLETGYLRLMIEAIIYLALRHCV